MAIAENFNILPLNLKSGNLEVRLAENNLEIDAAQGLRYKVFYEEMQARASLKQTKLKRDIDDFDHYFDHVFVMFWSCLLIMFFRSWFCGHVFWSCFLIIRWFQLPFVMCVCVASLLLLVD